MCFWYYSSHAPSWCALAARDFAGYWSQQLLRHPRVILLYVCELWICDVERPKKRRVLTAPKSWVRNCITATTSFAWWLRRCAPRALSRIFHKFSHHYACCLAQGQRHLRKVDAHSLKWGEKCLSFVRFNYYQLATRALIIIAYFLIPESIWKLNAPVVLHSLKTVNMQNIAFNSWEGLNCWHFSTVFLYKTNLLVRRGKSYNEYQATSHYSNKFRWLNILNYLVIFH